MINRHYALVTAGLALALAQTAHAQRDQISIVGSSTVYPFATVVAEQFGRKNANFSTPKIESTGSGGGLKLFCAGVGTQHPDITNASRAIKSSERDLCASNGVTEITEVLIGYDGIVLANSKAAAHYELTREEVFLALAKEVPSPDGQGMVENPFKFWNQVNPDLPRAPIEVLGPPPTSGTRDAFVELVMEEACESFPAIEALDDDRKDEACTTVREDGAFIEAGENDNLIVQKLQANPAALGIFGFSFLDQNADVIQAATMDGTDPTFDTIADGSYPVSRPLYFYVKNAHAGVIPGIQEFVAEFVSDAASGQEGYLTDRGLIPLSEELHAEMAQSASNLVPMQ